ncbi:acetyl-CoA carboxylase biotin carboxyl carrier protein subunit [Paraoerskovia sediminicola]
MVHVFRAGRAVRLAVPSRAETEAAARAARGRPSSATDPEVRSAMPGTVVAVDVDDGDDVPAGATLLTVEAMKMERRLLAPHAGTVSLSARVGDLVRADQVVAVVHPAATPEGES